MEPFKLYLSPINVQRFKAIVTESPGGEGETETTLPFFEGKIDRLRTLLKLLETTAGFAAQNFPEVGEQNWMLQSGILNPDSSAFHPHYLVSVGQALYQALFPSGSKVEEALRSALRLTEGHNNQQLHIQLKFEADSVKRSRLADYPWELLHDGQRFLIHHQVTISRYIAHETVPPNLPRVEQVNVLLVSSAAFDLEQGLKRLNKQEQPAVREGLKRASESGYISLAEPEYATFNALRAYLTEHRGKDAAHVLHFDGHGLFGKRCTNPQCRVINLGIKKKQCRVCNTILPDPQGYLVFEDESGGPDYISARELGALLQQSSLGDGSNQSSGVALVVLSACQSAMAVAGDSVFNGTAQNLIGHRIPAVVAMQYSVSVPAATQFAEQFYRSLGQKNSLAVAVSQGREAMRAEDNQWYRPVLYLRWRDNEGGQLFAARSGNQRPSEEQKLLNYQKQRIEGELKSHLPEGEPIDIGMEQQPKYVNYKDKGTDYELREQRLNENIFEVFEKTEFQNKLLILGPPGSGKTFTLLRLAKHLIESAENDSAKPIPYRYDLSSWKNEPIDEWLIKRLDNEVKLNNILPMLDGLDLLEQRLQERCIEQINKLIKEEKVRYLVVCSRTDAYAYAISKERPLELKVAVCLQPLTDKQIQKFLTGIGRNDIWNALNSNDNLKELFRVPLLLYKIITSYTDNEDTFYTIKPREFSSEQWQKLSAEEKLRLCIFLYIKHKIDKQQQKKYEQEKFITYILWLILLFNVNSQHFNKNLFTIDALQPSWLSTKTLCTYRIFLGFISLIICVSIPVFVGQESRVFFFLSLVASLIVALGIIRKTEIKLVWTLKWSLNQAKKYTPTILVSAFITGVIFAIIKPNLFCVVSLSTLIVGLLISGFDSRKPDGNRSSNQGIWQSIQNSIRGLVSGLIAGIIFWQISVLNGVEASLTGVKIIPILGILSWLITGGITCIQHLCLRLALYLSGCIPWNYDEFLSHAYKLGLLEKAGGGYRFVFAQLQAQLVETLNRVEEEEGNL